jgi:carboxypeptidase family protein
LDDQVFFRESVSSFALQRRAACGLVCATLLVESAAAEVPRLGVGDSALPGYFRVPVVALADRGALVGAGVGYAFTESQEAAPGTHHRVAGRVGAGLTPTPWLAFSFGTNLRHDRHAEAGVGADQGTVLDSDALVLVGDELGGELHVGAGVAGHFARGDELSRSLLRPALTLELLAAYVPDELPLSVGLLAGYRFDRTGRLLEHAAEYSEGDRLALQVSDFDAVVAGVGASYRLRETELLAEVGGDVLVGASAPSFAESPLRASLGGRQHLSEALSLRLDADVSLSTRAGRTPGDPLYPIEPRLQVAFGMAYQLLDWERREPAPDQPAPLRRPAPPAPGALLVNVTTLDGFPLSDAHVELRVGAAEQPVPHERLERYHLAGVAPGEVELRVGAERLATITRRVRVEPGQTLVVDVRLSPAARSGQIRGLVRSFDGRALKARIRVEPLGTLLSTDAAGSFSVDVPSGHYDVVIEAPGHGRQTRAVEVGEDGVVIVNADLRRAP